MAVILIILLGCVIAAFELGNRCGKLDGDERMYDEGFRDALSLVPDKAWSDAILDAYKEM